MTMPLLRRALGRATAALAGFALAGAVNAAPARAAGETVHIFAAASTTDAVRAIAARYEADHDATVRTVFAASSTVAKQVAAGAPADIYLSANVRWMDWLETRGEIRAATRTELLRNRLVVVAPKGRPDLTRMADLPDYLGDRRLAMGDPSHVPAGIYAKAALNSLGLWATVKPRAAFGSDVRAALALVGRGEASAGMVYATDARISDDVRVVATVPKRHHAPIRYPVAIVKGQASATVRDVFAYLQDTPAAEIWREHGFERAGGS
jgi:molybdate transport system substrate-binding protein